MLKTNCLIIGAGLAGLSTGYHLQKPYLVYEKEQKVGGLCRTESKDGYFFDLTGHLLHLRDDHIRQIVTELIGDRLSRIDRNSWIYSQECYTRYPFQANTFGLPVETVKECLMGFVEALMQRELEGDRTHPAQNPNFEQWILRTLGRGIAKYFMIPYNNKLWTIHPRDMSCDWMNRFVPQPKLNDVIDGALRDKPSSVGYNANFLYPDQEGIEILPRAIASRVDNIQLETSLLHVDVDNRIATFSNGDEVAFTHLVSSMPLPELLKIIQPLPPEIAELASRLRWASVYNVNFGLVNAPISDKHWIYVPEPEFPFYRVGYITNFAEKMAPPHRQSIYTEVSYSKDRPLPDRESLVDRIIRGLLKMHVISDKSQVDLVQIFDIPYAYVIYDLAYAEVVPKIHEYLRAQGIYSIGRYGRWVYGSMEDALIEGRETAQLLNQQK